MPKITAIVICLDGCEPEYLEKSINAGLMPNLSHVMEKGTVRHAHSVIPSFTNPNNISIATGSPPSVHGICGNYFFDPETKQEVMMNDVRFLQSPTLFKVFHDSGAKVAVVTAKDKLRKLLGAGLDFVDGKAICFSAEYSGDTKRSEHGLDNASSWLGMPVPEVYSSKLSEFVFASGVKLMTDWKPDLMYLTTTDYIQHKYAPGDPIANSFYAMFDKYLGKLDALGAVIVITGDHGMKAKHNEDGIANIVYIQDILNEWFGESVARVILPITDPYVIHHGALGSFATVYLPKSIDLENTIQRLSHVDGIELVLNRNDACEKFNLPFERIGDIILLSEKHSVIGTSVNCHDLTVLNRPLRSHGGLHEQRVPFIINRKMDMPNAPDLRNFDAFFYATFAAAL